MMTTTMTNYNPPSPFLSTRELLHYFESIFDNCRTKSKNKGQDYHQPIHNTIIELVKLQKA